MATKRKIIIPISRIIGTEGNDTLAAKGIVNHIEGMGGNDYITGSDGLDMLYGGAGNDTIHAGAGNDLVHGDHGDDVILAGTGDDTVHGGDGNDDIHGGDGHDQLFGDAGNDTIRGGIGNDVLDGGMGADLLEGGEGDDTIHGGGDGDRIDGGNGRDTLSYAHIAHSASISMKNGTAKVYSGATAHGEDSFAGIENVIGSHQKDSIFGNTAANEIHGLSGDDWITGDGGNDRLFGGDGKDRMFGDDSAYTDSRPAGAGDDYMDGGAGNDQMEGGWGNDTLIGGDGDDHLSGHQGADLLIGGNGTDTVAYTFSKCVAVNLATGRGNGGDAEGDIIREVENISGSWEADNLTGDAHANKLWGNGGHDILNGAGGRDTLIGGGGNDTIIGGAGADELTGGTSDPKDTPGAGRDVFRFNFVSDSTPQAMDVITDFKGSDGGYARHLARSAPVDDASAPRPVGTEAWRLYLARYAFVASTTTSSSGRGQREAFPSFSGLGMVPSATRRQNVAMLMLRIAAPSRAVRSGSMAPRSDRKGAGATAVARETDEGWLPVPGIGWSCTCAMRVATSRSWCLDHLTQEHA